MYFMSELCIIFTLIVLLVAASYLNLRGCSQLGSECTTVVAILGALFDVTDMEHLTG